MDLMKMLEDWRRILGRSVFVFHIMSVVMGVVVLLSVMSLPYLSGSSPSNAELGYAFLGGALCFFASCAFGGGVRYAFYEDFKLMPSRSFRHYFSGDGEGEHSAYITQALPARSQRGHDDDRAVLHVSYTRLAMRQMEVYSRSVQDRLVEQFGEPMAQLMGRYDFLAKPEGKANSDGFMRAVAYARR